MSVIVLRLAHEVVLEKNQINMAKGPRANAVLDDVERNRPLWKVGQWAWVYNGAKTINQGATSKKTSLDNVLKSKPSWIGLNLPKSWPLGQALPHPIKARQERNFCIRFPHG